MISPVLERLLISIESLLSGLFLSAGILSVLFVRMKIPASRFLKVLIIWCTAAFLHTFFTGATKTMFSFPDWLILLIERFSLLIMIFLLPVLQHQLFTGYFRLKSLIRQGLPLLTMVLPALFLNRTMAPLFTVLLILLCVIHSSLPAYLLQKKQKPPLRLAFEPGLFILTLSLHLTMQLLHVTAVYLVPLVLILITLILITGYIHKISRMGKGFFAMTELKLQQEKLKLEENLKQLNLKLEKINHRQQELMERKKSTLGLLTNREKEIFELLLGSQTYREIADSLFISERTVNIHIQNIYKKCGVKSRHELHTLFHDISTAG